MLTLSSLLDNFNMSGNFYSDKNDLWESWSDLEADKYIKGAYQFRYRRYSRFMLLPDRQLTPLPHIAFFQSMENNSYAGGVAREFAPLDSSTINNRFLAELIRCDFDLLPMSHIQKQRPWEIDVHQYRVISDSHKIGHPTPEGIHRDGFDYFAVHLINKKNVYGGVSQIYNNERELIDSFSLESTLDSLLVADNRVMHAVTPITPIDHSLQAVRDTLIINFISEPRMVKDSREAVHSDFTHSANLAVTIS